MASNTAAPTAKPLLTNSKITAQGEAERDADGATTLSVELTGLRMTVSSPGCGSSRQSSRLTFERRMNEPRTAQGIEPL